MRNLNKILILVGFLISFSGNAQNSSVKSFFKLPRPEKCWVIAHVFKAKSAFILSEEAKNLADSIKNTNLLDGDANGGQVDAFRHSYWMAILSQKIGIKAAKKLGEKHEKGNYIYYKKHKTEDGTIPDEVSSQMDLFNNKIGISIFLNNSNASKKEIEQIIIEEIKAGKMQIIKKNSDGDFLDCDGNIIQKKDLKGKWENNKCLIFSDGKPRNLNLY